MSERLAIYYDGWKDYEQLKADYGDKLPPREDILYAGYTYEDYSGSALVVFVKDGKLFENNDGHCSCNGLSDWSPEETSIEALEMRKGWPGLKDAMKAYRASTKRLRIVREIIYEGSEERLRQQMKMSIKDGVYPYMTNITVRTTSTDIPDLQGVSPMDWARQEHELDAEVERLRLENQLLQDEINGLNFALEDITRNEEAA